MLLKKWMACALVIFAVIIKSAHGQNESFPYHADVYGHKVAGLFDQRVFLSTTNSDSNTYYNLTIMQKGIQDKT